jgi:hypothetical protein
MGIHTNAVNNTTIEKMTFNTIMMGLMMIRYQNKYSTDTTKKPVSGEFSNSSRAKLTSLTVPLILAMIGVTQQFGSLPTSPVSELI